MNELTTTDQHRRPSRDLAVDVPRAKLGSVEHRWSSVSRRRGPLPPLANLVEMERKLQRHGELGIAACCFVLIVLIPMLAIWFLELFGVQGLEPQ